MQTKRHKGKATIVLSCLSLLATGALAQGASAATHPGQGFLPDNRAWEMVSPPNKNGGGVIAASADVRAAANGEGATFRSLGAFAGTKSLTAATEYLARRSSNPDPGDNGWQTHGIVPQSSSLPLTSILDQFEPRYLGDLSPDLSRGILLSLDSLTEDPYTFGVPNFFRLDTAASGGSGARLISSCPACEASDTPLPSLEQNIGGGNSKYQPRLAGATPDFEHAIFESIQPLSADLPAKKPDARRLYEWNDTEVALAGRIPTLPETHCDDVEGPTCSAADVSIAGAGASSGEDGAQRLRIAPHTLSDGSDGHIHVFFTRPTNATGTKVEEEGTEGRLYERTDGVETTQLNVPEAGPTTFARAKYLDASADGTRAFFLTTQPLTEGAPATGQKLYMYSNEPDGEEHHLTLVGAEKGEFHVLIGASEDGSRVYFYAGAGIYLWDEGALSFVAPLTGVTGNLGSYFSQELEAAHTGEHPGQPRVSPDGEHLLFPAYDGSSLTGYDHGHCGGTESCRELYLYSAETGALQCASCNPSGAAATADATIPVSTELRGFTNEPLRITHALSDDGRYAFFSSAERLVPEDTDGVSDAYEFDSASGEVHLLSSGEDSSPSYFMDSSADGRDAFFATGERLSGWDTDNAYDLYDARIGGGFPEPPPPAPSCQGDACQPAPVSLNDPTPSSASFTGPGDAHAAKHKHRAKHRAHAKHKRHAKRHANHKRRTGR